MIFTKASFGIIQTEYAHSVQMLVVRVSSVCLQGFESREAGQGGDRLQSGLPPLFLLIRAAHLLEYGQSDDAVDDGQNNPDEDAEVDDEAAGCRDRLADLWVGVPSDLGIPGLVADGHGRIHGGPRRQKVLDHLGHILDVSRHGVLYSMIGCQHLQKE